MMECDGSNSLQLQALSTILPGQRPSPLRGLAPRASSSGFGLCTAYESFILDRIKNAGLRVNKIL